MNAIFVLVTYRLVKRRRHGEFLKDGPKILCPFEIVEFCENETCTFIENDNKG